MAAATVNLIRFTLRAAHKTCNDIVSQRKKKVEPFVYFIETLTKFASLIDSEVEIFVDIRLPDENFDTAISF